MELFCKLCPKPRDNRLDGNVFHLKVYTIACYIGSYQGIPDDNEILDFQY